MIMTTRSGSEQSQAPPPSSHVFFAVWLNMSYRDIDPWTQELILDSLQESWSERLRLYGLECDIPIYSRTIYRSHIWKTKRWAIEILTEWWRLVLFTNRLR